MRNKYGIPMEKGCGIYNGDIGIIREINTFAELVTVEFDEDVYKRQTQYIMGKITKDDYLAQLEVWKERGGDKIAKEFAAAYEEREGRK